MPDNIPILDERVFATLQEDVGPSSAVILVQSLKEEIRNSEILLQAYAQDRNMRLLENQAHALKSAARSFGALRLGEVCRALEGEAKDGAPQTILANRLLQFQQVSSESLTALEGLVN